MHRSASATNTDAELSITLRMSVIVSVMLGDVLAACHNARSASASSGRHSRMKKVSILSEDFLFVKPTHHTAQVFADLFDLQF